MVTDGIEMLITTLSSPLILETLGFYPADYSKMLAEQKKATMKDATSRLASRLVSVVKSPFALLQTVGIRIVFWGWLGFMRPKCLSVLKSEILNNKCVRRFSHQNENKFS